MKSAATAVCAAAAPRSASSGVCSGRVRHRRNDDQEVQMYLSKLRQLLPEQPTNRRLSKLEVIQHVIEYICDLQYALEMPIDESSATTTPAQSESSSSASPESLPVSC